jgi:hypothetical protein
MFKLILIFALIFFVLYKVGSFFFKIGAATQQFREHQQKKTTKSGNGGKPKSGKFTGGEYIDYEEVK